VILAYFGQNLDDLPYKFAIRNVFFTLADHEYSISAVSRRKAFIAILVPLTLVYESVIDEFSDNTNPILKPNSAWIYHMQLKLRPFCDIFAYLGQNLVAVATSLRPLQWEMSSLDWSTTKTPL